MAISRITPDDFQILGYVLQKGAAKIETLAFKYPPVSVRKMIDKGYLLKFGKGFVGLSKKGRRAVTLALVR